MDKSLVQIFQDVLGLHLRDGERVDLASRWTSPRLEVNRAIIGMMRKTRRYLGSLIMQRKHWRGGDLGHRYTERWVHLREKSQMALRPHDNIWPEFQSR